MKVTVSFGSVKVVVPCGQGNLLVKDLAQMAVLRFKKSTMRATEVVRATATPAMSRSCGSTDFGSSQLNKGPGLVELGDDGTYCEVISLTLARDGGILDWDDRVTDVLDDREQLVAHYRIIHKSRQADDWQRPPSPQCSYLSLSRCNGQTETQVSSVSSFPLSEPKMLTFQSSACEHALSGAVKQSDSMTSLLPPPPPLRFTKMYQPLASDSNEKLHAQSAVMRLPTTDAMTSLICGLEHKHLRPAPPPPRTNLPQPDELTGDGQTASRDQTDLTMTEHCSSCLSSADGLELKTLEHQWLGQECLGSRPPQFHGHCPLLTDQLISSDPTVHQCVPICLSQLQTNSVNYDSVYAHNSKISFPTATPLPIPPYPSFDFDRLGHSSNASSLDSSNALSTVPEEEGSQARSNWSTTSEQKNEQSDTNSTPTLRCSSSSRKMVGNDPGTDLNKHSSDYPQPTTVPSETTPDDSHSTPSTPHLARTGRKFKRRRAPRAAPPPPPTSVAHSSTNYSAQPPPWPPHHPLQETLSTSTSSEEMDERIKEDTRTVRRKPHTIVNIGNYKKPTSVNEASSFKHNCDKSGFATELVTQPLSSGSTLMPELRHSATTDHSVASTTPATCMQVVDEHGSCMGPHWKSSTDCLPGYSPRALADAELILQADSEHLNASRVGEREHYLSMDEERFFSVKPAPPKRSPLTVLTGMPFLTSTDQPGAHSGPVNGRGNRLREDNGTGQDGETGEWVETGDNGKCDVVGTIDRHPPNHSGLNEESEEEEETESQRCIAAAEDEVLHMTEMLSKRRESEARRHLVMAELEADMERDHRLQAAATAMALAAVSSLNAARKNRTDMPSKASKCPWHSRTPKSGKMNANEIGNKEHSNTGQHELLIVLRKTSSGLGFSLTTKPLMQAAGDPSASTSSDWPTGVYVKSILPDGAALRDGQLRLGDQLLRIDNQDVRKKTQAQIVAILRTKPVDSLVQLRVRRYLRSQTSTPQHSVAKLTTCSNCFRQRTKEELSRCPENCSYHHPGILRDPRNPIHSSFPLYHTLALNRVKLVRGEPLHMVDKTMTRCASPVFPQRVSKLMEEVPELVTSTDYPSFPDVLIMRLDVSLSNPVDLDANRDKSNTDGSSESIAVQSKHMRLGVSVREACSSRLSRLHIPVDEDTGNLTSAFYPIKAEEMWCNPDSVYGGVVVKGIIEGGAAHKDGRLRVGDELLEVNTVSLVNITNPLSVLRSILKQATCQRNAGHRGTAEDRIQSGKKPTVQLLVARQSRHRRSASGHTLASNSELTNDGSSTVTSTTLLAAALPIRQATDGSLNTSPGISDGLGAGGPEETSSSGHAVQIAADVHSMDEFNQASEPISAANTKCKHTASCLTVTTKSEGLIYSVANNHIITTTSSTNGKFNAFLGT